ncbi:MAG: cysteine--tRNA ligase [Candidatus Dojkabacteria bacterium]
MLKIYNTLGRELETFKSIKDKYVSIYRCGPTVYWTQHIGNMRGMVMSDLIERTLKYEGYKVKFVQNYTDVGHLTSDEDEGEDKMEKGAKREGLSPKEIADKYIAQFENDVAKLNVLEPDYKPRATEYVKQMIEMVQELLDKGFAYERPNAIYFDISKFPKYNELNGQRLDMNREGEGHGDVTDENKKNPQDFALWFFRTDVHKNALQYWPSPFKSSEVENGEGFPGWHIECSAMARDLLGNPIDIHIGGIEHIAVHHTNEIAQSEAANGEKFANYWLHHEHLDVDGKKMSKSLGNIYSLDNILESNYSPMHLRYFFLQAHYRSKQNFTFEALDGAKKAYERLINFVKTWAEDSDKQKSNDFKINKGFKEKFTEAIEDDFNIPNALAIVWELTKSDLQSDDKLGTLLDFDKVLGLGLEHALSQPKEKEIPLEAQMLIEERNIARLSKDFKKADEIRDQLKSRFGVDVVDKR